MKSQAELRHATPSESGVSDDRTIRFAEAQIAALFRKCFPRVMHRPAPPHLITGVGLATSA